MNSVSESALVKRINRALRRGGDSQRVCLSRSESELGRAYAVDDRNCVTATDIDLESWGSELRVLRGNERAAA